MFWKHSKLTDGPMDLQESIKQDIVRNLSAKGITISGVVMEMKPDCISLNLQLLRIKKPN
jgi:hypothetical protein